MGKKGKKTRRDKAALKHYAENPETLTGRKLAAAAPDVERRLQDTNAAPSDDAVLGLTADMGALAGLWSEGGGKVSETDAANLSTAAQLASSKHAAVPSSIAQNLEEGNDMFSAFFGSIARNVAPGNPELQHKLSWRLRTLNQNQKASQDKARQFDMTYMIPRLQKILDGAIDADKDEIVAKCFGGNEVAFHQNFPLYKTTLAYFEQNWLSVVFQTRSDPKASEMYQQGATLLQSTANASRDIAFGAHKTTQVCWTCGELASSRCEICDVAKYCCRKCQVSDWKAKHKKVCASLKEAYALVREGRELVDQAFKDPEKYKVDIGLSTGPSTREYDVATKYLMQQYMMGPASFLAEVYVLPGPKMSFFYDNLRRVAKEDFWLHPEFSKAFRKEEARHKEDQYTAIANAMLYDYSNFETALQMKRFCEMSYKNNGGVFQMTSDEFLFIHDSFGDRCESAEEEEGYVEMIKKTTRIKLNEQMRQVINTEKYAKMMSLGEAMEQLKKSMLH